MARVTVPEGRGFGIELREEPFRNGDAIAETIAERRGTNGGRGGI
jgi:hypothetical protein